jgi:hypothetical protein
MKRAGSVFSLGSEFDDFLLAPIGDDHTGMQLSVLSALARLDVDPWEQAAALARLPDENATLKLASLIAALPAGPGVRADSRTIAARLIPLLPRHATTGTSSPAPVSGTQALPRSPLLTYLILYGVFTLFMLAIQWMVAAPHGPSAVNSAPVPPASSVSAQPSSPNTSQ